MKPTKLIILVVIVTVCLFTSSKMISALSVGYLKVERNDQTGFRGEIPIYLNQSELSKEVQVLLGNESDYAMLGKELPPALEGINVTFERKGQPKAVLSSDRPLTHEAFELIVKVMVDGGALLKRFPMALKEINSEKDLSLALKKTREMVKEAVENVVGSRKEEAALTKPARQVYGPVRRGETLWSIAARISPDKDNIGRIAVGIWKKNMQAFRFSNIHGLKSNVYLDYSNIDEAIEGISRREANRLMALQWKEWKGRTSRKALAKKRPEAQRKEPRAEEKPPVKIAKVEKVKKERVAVKVEAKPTAEVKAVPKEEMKLHLAEERQGTGSSISFLKPISASIEADMRAASEMDEKGSPAVAAAMEIPKGGGPTDPLEGVMADLENLKKEMTLTRVNLAGRIGAVESQITGRFGRLEMIDRAFYSIFILENIILIALLLRSQRKKRYQPSPKRERAAATRRYVATNLNQRYL